MKGFGGGLQNIMRQANQMQLKIKKLQEELAAREFTGSSGGDAVVVHVSGAQKVLSVTIKPEVMSAGDVEMLQDLVLTATNEALKTARETSDKEIAKITGGLTMPGMF